MAQRGAQDASMEETMGVRATAPFKPLVLAHGEGDPVTSAHRWPSYHPTGITLADRAFDLVDGVSNGHADWVQRFVSYSCIGGIASVINLLTLALVLTNAPIPGDSRAVHYGIAFAVAAEVSLMANFIPNDRITFSHLPGHSRSWLARCLRFHLTCIGGILITALVSGVLHLVVNVPALTAQAIALMLALAFNFSFHHIFTYGHARPAQDPGNTYVHES